MWYFTLLALYVHIVSGENPIKVQIVCYIHLPSGLNDALQNQLATCSDIIVSGDAFYLDRAPRVLFDSENLARLRHSAPHARIFLSVLLTLSLEVLRTPTGSEWLIQQMSASLPLGLYDGIDLDFDPTTLELFDQIGFARFLSLLKLRLGTTSAVTTAIDCRRPIAPPLVRAMNECLDMVVLLSMSEVLHSISNSSDFNVRKYSAASINCALDAGLHPERIVLGLQTVGVLVNPLATDLDLIRLKNSDVEFLSYGQVCELQQQQQKFCAWRGNGWCSLFNNRAKLIYDEPETATERTVQCLRRRLRGVSILLSYDDHSGLCNRGGTFPLLSAIQNAINRSQISLNECEERLHSSVDETTQGSSCSCGTSSCCGGGCDNKMNSSVEIERIARLEAAIDNTKGLSTLVQKLADTLLNAMKNTFNLVVSLADCCKNRSPAPPMTTDSNESLGLSGIINFLETAENKTNGSSEKDRNVVPAAKEEKKPTPENSKTTAQTSNEQQYSAKEQPNTQINIVNELANVGPVVNINEEEIVDVGGILGEENPDAKSSESASNEEITPIDVDKVAEDLANVSKEVEGVEQLGNEALEELSDVVNPVDDLGGILEQVPDDPLGGEVVQAVPMPPSLGSLLRK
ncbi:uncharacterized protein LOC129720635 [Wyeomyia smithii]|uniref:uncharacterized protein LOC129720635 n=1 Tax=Wyeomyia smithii TaxID=174621 RepID=UPI002467FAB9|nr:uncharacterized protein LOC129720635 [Wyeomyia smithii]